MLRVSRQAETFAIHMAVEDIPPADLYLHPSELAQYFNPANEIRQEKLDKIRQQGTEDGIRFPVQVNTDGEHARLDDGHHRVVVAGQDGMDKVPVMVLPVDKAYFKGKQSGFAPPAGPGLKKWLGVRTASNPTKLYRGLNLDTRAPGMEQVHKLLQDPTGWDHPDVGGHILNWLQSGPKKGIGPHWTSDPAQAERFASWPNEETGRGGNLQAVVEGEWGGEGEDLGRTDTQEFDEQGNRIRSFPEERERTLSPGAQLNVTGVKIRPYDDDYWNSPSEGTEPIDHDHDGPWHHVFGEPSVHTAAIDPDKDNLRWDWDKGKWVPRQDPDEPTIPKREERGFDYDRDWPGWREAYIDETPWLNAAWDDDDDDDEEVSREHQTGRGLPSSHG